MYNYKIIDSHCDTLLHLNDKKCQFYKNNLHTDIKKLSAYENYAQFFAVFISPEHYNRPILETLSLINRFYKAILSCNDKIMFCKSSEDLDIAWNINKIGAFLSIEGGEGIKNIELLRLYHSLGVRMIALTWNNDNLLAGGIANNRKGLTELGKEIIFEMNKLKIITDLSHASEKTFYDVSEISTLPIVLSHSNSYSICNNKRNITDAQFELVKKSEGVVGITFHSPFLTDKQYCSTEDIAEHIFHFLSLGGEDNICIGSDFDGTDILPDGIKNALSVHKIFDLLSQKGVSDEILEKIAYKNIRRVIHICL